MYNDTSQPPEPYFGWGPSLYGSNLVPQYMGAEFVRGRVCQGPSLLGAEMSRNRLLFSYEKRNHVMPHVSQNFAANGLLNVAVFF